MLSGPADSVLPVSSRARGPSEPLLPGPGSAPASEGGGWGLPAGRSQGCRDVGDTHTTSRGGKWKDRAAAEPGSSPAWGFCSCCAHCSVRGPRAARPASTQPWLRAGRPVPAGGPPTPSTRSPQSLLAAQAPGPQTSGSVTEPAWRTHACRGETPTVHLESRWGQVPMPIEVTQVTARLLEPKQPGPPRVSLGLAPRRTVQLRARGCVRPGPARQVPAR